MSDLAFEGLESVVIKGLGKPRANVNSSGGKWARVQTTCKNKQKSS